VERMKRGGPHPPQETLERFMRCKVSRAERSAVVRHLLTNCPRCVELTSRWWGLGEWPRALKVLLQEAARQERSAARHRQSLLQTGGL
jgi:hypothetical protein